MKYVITFLDNSSAFLSHYGVKGMKWGIRNEETLERYSRDGKGFFNGNLTGGGGYLPEDLVLGNDKEIEENPDMWQMKDVPWDADSDMKAVNIYRDLALRDLEKMIDSGSDSTSMFSYRSIEDYGYAGYKVNCATCSMVYDLRRRGFDVDANGTTNAADQLVNNISNYYIGAKYKDCAYIDDMMEDINRFPNGARGCLSGVTVKGGGHAIAWEKENGEVFFRDCQNNKSYKRNELDQIFKFNSRNNKLENEPYDSYSLSYVRLDDKTPNLKNFREDGIVSSNKNSYSEFVKDKKRSKSGYYNSWMRRYKKELSEYEQELKDLNEKVKDPSYSRFKDLENDINRIKKSIADLEESKNKL